MQLLEFIKPLSASELEAFALSVGATVGHLRNVAYGTRIASAALARQIELRSMGAVLVSTLRPKDWHLVWDQCPNQLVNERAIVGQSGVEPIGAVQEKDSLPAEEVSHAN